MTFYSRLNLLGIRLLVVVILAGAASCASPKHSASDGSKQIPAGLNDRFKDPDLDIDEWMNRFEVESREIFAHRHEVVDALDLESGMAVADVGAGTGLFVKPFSDAVGAGGHVYAVDIAPRFIEHINERAQAEGLRNVTAVLSSETSVNLAKASVDLVFICDTYHHFAYPEEMMQSIRDALRPEGRLAVIDFERIPGVSREWVLGHVRAGEEVFTEEIEAAGFEKVDDVEIGGFRENYFLIFERR